MCNQVKFIVFFFIGILLVSCDMPDRKVLAKFVLPNKVEKAFKFEVTNNKPHGIYLKMLTVTPIPKQILSKCKVNNNELCLVYSLYGDMPWEIHSSDGSIVSKGDYRNIQNLHPKIIPLGFVTLEPGKYKLLFLPSRGYSNSVSERLYELYIE